MSDKQNRLTASQKKSDYGSVSLDICDGQLRQHVVSSIATLRAGDTQALSDQHIDEIAAYINRLEDALLRHHWGLLAEAEILDHLKQCTGLDIKSLAYSLESMLAEDA